MVLVNQNMIRKHVLYIYKVMMKVTIFVIVTVKMWQHYCYRYKKVMIVTIKKYNNGVRTNALFPNPAYYTPRIGNTDSLFLWDVTSLYT